MFRKFSIYFTLLLLLLWIGLVQSATVNLSIDETTVSEGNFFTLTVSLDISASEDTTGLGTVLVRFTTVPDNDQSDFSSLPTSTTLDLANPVKSFAVLAEDDNVVEEPETFTFKIGILLSSGNVTVGESTPSVTVRDRNPGKLEFTSSNYFVDENGVNAIITVERVDGSDGEISVDYATSDDTAIAGTHYHAAQGTLTWVDKDSNPQPITVVIFDNESYDGDKTLKLSLSQPSGGATLGLRNPATVTIKDDETPPPPPTVDPDTVTLNVGNSTELNISGGTPPYQVISTDENVATVSITGNVATVTAIGTGTATIRITDQARDSVEATVNVIAPPPPTVDPDTVTLNVGNSTELNISGGIPPYEVISTDENVATVSLTGNVATVTAIGTGTATIRITDQARASVDATVNVIAPPPTVEPNTVTLKVGNSTELNISGGIPPYQVISTDENVATVSITDNVATVTAIGTGSAIIKITDQASASVEATVIVIPPPLAVEPNTVTLKVGNSTELNISGGIPPYQVISTDENVATVSITDNVATVTAIGTGSAIIKITDQASASVEATVIVIPPPLAVGPDTVTLKVGNKKELNISGGTPRYEVISTDETVATVSLTGNVVTVTAIGTGTATIRITDQAGASVEVIVNVILCDLIEGKPCLYWKLDREQNSDSIIKVGERLTLNLELIDIQDANTDQAFDLYVAFALPPEYVIPLVFLSDIGFVTEIRPLKKNIKPEDNSFTNLNPILDFEVGECLGDETYTYYAALFDQDNDELASNLAVGEVTFEDKCD
jgi:hypothetical protein